VVLTERTDHLQKLAEQQENGYFVLRFLAEDVGKHLDNVLDAILRALAHQAKTIQPWSNGLSVA
jgi:very-short-patch-repair endonuclease